MEYLDARRLTGPSLLWDKAGSILDIRCTPRETAELVPVWRGNVERMLDAESFRRDADLVLGMAPEAVQLGRVFKVVPPRQPVVEGRLG